MKIKKNQKQIYDFLFLVLPCLLIAVSINYL